MYSSVQIAEMIRENENNKRYFYTEISPRFSDYMYDSRLHVSKIFEFFEMARFEVMNDFFDFFGKMRADGNKPNFGNFVVVRVKCDNFDCLNSPKSGKISIKTALTVHQKPLLEFDQAAFTDENQMLTKANIKIATVDRNSKTLENWGNDVLTAMLEFIKTKGKEELL